MPTYVVKLGREQDAYVMWSTIVDGPASTVGTRAECEAYLKRSGLWQEGRLERADETGTSMVAGWYGFDDPSVLYRDEDGLGVGDRDVPRGNLLAFCRAYDAKDSDAMRAASKALVY